MFKIDKCARLATRITEIAQMRFKSSKNDSCPKCPPSYQCVQPQKGSRDEEIEVLPPLLQCKQKHDYRPWKNIFLFICVPLIIGQYINVFYMADEKKKRPKFVEYSYLRIRRKPFPWGEKTLLHHPRYNALPSGYEFEVPEDEEYDP